MSRIFGRVSGGVRLSVFVMAALALLMAGREAQATGLLDNVPEAAGYSLVYEFPIPVSSLGWATQPVPYSVDNSASIATGAFDRVAYYMEVVKLSGETQWVYVSMTPFTAAAARLGVPRNYVLRYGAYDTAAPSNATIRSNVSGITNTNGLDAVNLEFWPSNYGNGNDYGVPGASAATFDFGDGGAGAGAGHASMQIHNYGAGQTLFAYNHWGNAGTGEFGVGNQVGGSGNPDWTFNGTNINNYTSRTLQILVRSLSINNLPATNVTDSSGCINAQATVGNSCDVWAFWGDTDQTTNSTLWATNAFLGTYSNGTFNLTRQVTGLSGGATNWYTFLASNDVALVWATPSLSFVTATTPAVDNGAGASVSVGQAVLRGNLTAGGTSDIYIYWGLADGGQSTNYEHVVKLADVPMGAFSATVSGFSGFDYHYICFATNAAGMAWSPASTSFALPAPGGGFNYSVGLRGSVFQPATFAQATIDLSGATYSTSFTRVFTGSKTGTVLAMSELPAKNIVFLGPVNSWNEFGGSPGDYFVAALSGRFFPSASGSYNFRWSEDDRGWLFIDTGDDGVFDSGDAVGTYAWDGNGSRTLTAGQGYNFMFFSQEAAGGDSLAFWYTPPGSGELVVNPSTQSGQWRYASSTVPLASIATTPLDPGTVTATSATLKGDLYGKNWSFDVYACWGRADGGNVAANWETNAFVGRFEDWDGPVSLAVDGMASNALYHYTFFITNNLLSAWAATPETFVTGEVTIEASDASASEAGPDTGRFRVIRPDAATNGALTVNYTISGTAVSGSDYAALAGSVIIPAGETSAEITVTPLDDMDWQEGDETVVAALAAGSYLVGAADSAAVTIHEGDPSPSEWFYRLPLQFTGYDRPETLTNFPLLVTLGTNVNGFSYSQFLSGANGELRFADGSLTRELPYEIESWDAEGLSRVWVRVPALTNNATIWMLWRKAGMTAPAYTTSGEVWSEGYLAVAHQSESEGTVFDSSANGNHGIVSGFPAQDVPGAIAGGDQFDGMDDLVYFATLNRPVNNFTYSAWIKTAQAHQVDAQGNTGTAGTSGQKYAFDPEHGGTANSGSGLSVGTNGVSVYEHGDAYMPALAVYAADIGSDWNSVTVAYRNKQPLLYLNGSLVSTGATSPRTLVYAPRRIGGPTYGYLTGSMDETRISSVTRSANWIWAEYMNAASNSALAAVGPVVSGDYPEIASQPASGVASTAATLNGYLSQTGMAATAVAVYWGTQDGGADAGAWANTNWFASPAAPGVFATNITGLSSGTAYFYRYAATNAYGTAWALTTETLLTAAVTLQATDASAAEEPADTGVITVSRGTAQDGPLTIYYTLGGTAVNGVDNSFLSGAVTIPDGATSADIVVTPLFNRNYLVRATDTVTLTLAAGGYLSGSPDSDTVTITNWQPSTAVQRDVPRNFLAATIEPLAGPETQAKTSAGQLMLGSSAGSTFKGDILVDTDGGVLRVGGIPGATGTGLTLPGMTAANTITVRRGGNFYIDDNALNNAASSVANRFGTSGSRPAVQLEGGTLTLNGPNTATTVPQTFGPLALASGYNVVTATRNSAGTPELVFGDLNPAKGAHVNFTGTSLGAAANAPRIRFQAAPAVAGGGGAAGTTTLSIMPGARYGSDWVTYDGTTGVRPLAATEYNNVAGNDVNVAGAADNVRVTNALPTTFPTLSADKTVNSLNINVNASASWTPTNKLILASGQLISGVQNQQMVINYPSALTAGSGSSDASLDVSVFQNNTYVRSRIDDNGSGKVTLTKNGGSTLILDGSVDNTYSGGTFINEGTITTGGTANRRYLSLGPVRIDAGWLWLGHVGATANPAGYDYTAVNAGQVGVATAAYAPDDMFNIGAGSVICGNSGLGIGLNSLDRGIGVPGATPNIALAADAVVARTVGLSAPLDLATGTIKNLGANADLYYGLSANQDLAAGAITLGSNTAFKGISTDRSDRRWSQGTINVSAGTGEISLRGLPRPGTTPALMYFGNGLTAGYPVLAPADVGPLTANVLGYVVLEDSAAVYGDTSAGKPVTFAVKAGALLYLNQPGSMGSGTGVASARIEDGGTLIPNTPPAINGAVTVASGGRFLAGNSGGLTGSGAVAFESGSVLEISTPLGFSGSQADATAASLPPGQLVRLNADYYGSPVETLDSRLGAKSPVYEVFGGDRRHVNPLVAGTTVMTLSRDVATGAGGMLVNDYASRSFAAAANGILVIGPNGGTIAATSNTTLYVTQPLSLGANALTIGATNMLDRILLPKLGTVQFNSAFGLNTALAGSSITVIPGATLNNSANTIPDAADVTVDGTLLVGGTETIGSLAGAGLVNLQANSLTVGRNNNDSVFSGTLTNTLASALFNKTGSGRLQITSRQNAFTAAFTVNNGILALSGDGAITNVGTTSYTLAGSGTLLLDNSTVNNRDRLCGVGAGVIFNGGTFRFAGKNGEASGEALGAASFSSGAATIDIVNGTGAGSSVEVAFAAAAPSAGTVNFTASNGTLGAAGDNPRVFFNGLDAGLLGYATVDGAPAYYDTDTGVRAYTLAEGTEFDGTADQTGLDTTYTAANLHQPLSAARAVNSLWIDNPGAGNVVNLGSSGAYGLTLASGRLLLSGANDFALTRSGTSSGTLTREGNGTLFLGVDSGRTLTVSVPIANGAGLVEKDGAGSLVLDATNTFAGALSINAGTVRYAAGYTGDLNGNAVNIWNSGVLDFAGDTDTLGALAIYCGGVTNSGAGGILTAASLTMGGGPAGSSSYVRTGAGSLKLGGNVAFSALNDPDMATVAGALDLNGASRTFTVNNSVAAGAAVDMDVPAVISGGAGFGITKNGAGVLRLSGANTFNGNVSVPDNNGTVILAHPQAPGAPSFGRTITVGTGDSLVLDGANGNIAISANYTNLFLNGGGDGLMGTVRGALMSLSGSNTVPCRVHLNGGTYLASMQAGGTLNLTGLIGGVQDLSVYGEGDTVLGGAIVTGAKALVKNGSGTLTLDGSGTNTFSGTTTVNAGTLVLAKASGTTAINAIAGGAVNVNNGGVLRYAASSANPDLMGAGAVTLNGGAQLDFNGASDTIGTVTVAASGATADTTNILNTAGGGSLTVASLTVNPAHGYLTRIDSGTGTLSLGGNVTFNAASTGRALLSGNLALGSTSRTLTVNTGIHTNHDMAIDAVISGSAGAGITKAGGGILRLDGANTFDGNLSVGNSLGSVVLGNSRALGAPSVARTVTIGTADTLALDGVGIYDPNNRIALNLNGTGNPRHGLVSGALVSLAGSNTVPCAIALAGATQIASLQAGGKLTLSGAFSGAQTLTFAGPGEAALAGPNGAVPSATAITVTSNGVLTLENSVLTNNANRIGTMPVTLAGGTFRFSHDGGAANFSESGGALTIAAGSNTVYASQASGGQTSALTFASLTRAGGTVNFVGEGLGDSDQNRIFITGQADGMIGPWAFINGASLACYSAARGVYAATDSVGIAARGNDPNAVIPDNAGVAAVISLPGDNGPITLQAPWTNRILEVRQETAYTSVVAMAEGVTNRTLQTSRLMIQEGKEPLTIGEAENSGMLMALSPGGVLSLENQNASRTLTVKAAVVNNGVTASGLAKFGLGTVLLTGSNSYAGATSISEGTLEFGGSLAQKLAGVISGAGTLAKSGTNLLHLTGANTYTGPTYINAGLVRPDQNAAFGTTASGVTIASGATLDLGCDSAVGGTRTADQLNMGVEEFTVGGAGVGGTGAIVNNGNVNQANAINRIYLSADTTFGGKSRWDLRSNSFLFMNGHTLTKTGACEIAIISTPVYPGSGHMVVNQGMIRFESGTLVNGTAANTVTVNSGAILELYNLYPCKPAWSLILNEGAFFRGSGNSNPSTAVNIWDGPVTLNGRAFFNGNASPAHWTVSGEISGSGPLVKAGNSGATLWLTGTNNTYSGGTIVSNGVLYAKYPGSLPDYGTAGKISVQNGATLAVSYSAEEGAGWTEDQIHALRTNATFATVSSYLGIDTTLGDLVYTRDIAQTLGLAKYGTNTLTLAGRNTYGGYTLVYGGTLRLPETSVTNNMARLFVGYGGSTGAVIQTGCAVAAGSTVGSTEALALGFNGTGYGYYRMTGGSLATGQLGLPSGSGGHAVFELYEGTVTVDASNGWMIWGWNSGSGVLNMFGGSLFSPPSGNDTTMSYSVSKNSFGMLNMLGSSALMNATGYGTSRSFNMALTNGNRMSVINLNSGTLVANRIFVSNTNTPSFLNFNGGTLRANMNHSAFLQGLSFATVYGGGAVIDTTNVAITVNQRLLAPAGYGIVGIPLLSSGAGYIGAPVVTIAGGSGTGATAIASVDLGDGSPTKGRVTEIIVTSPGTGYLAGDRPTVTLVGGGCSVMALTADCVLGLNDASGGLTKLGSGTLTLSGANTYTGVTAIAAGTLKLGIANALMPNTLIELAGGALDLNGYTVTNAISGMGVVSNGTLSTVISPAGAGAVGTNTLSFSSVSVKGTYLADVTSGGACDRVNIQGNIDLSNIDLQVVDTDALTRGHAYTILTCTGARTGTFKSTNIADSRWHLVYRPDGSVQLIYLGGTLMRIR